MALTIMEPPSCSALLATTGRELEPCKYASLALPAAMVLLGSPCTTTHRTPRCPACFQSPLFFLLPEDLRVL